MPTKNSSHISDHPQRITTFGPPGDCPRLRFDLFDSCARYKFSSFIELFQTSLKWRRRMKADRPLLDPVSDLFGWTFTALSVTSCRGWLTVEPADTRHTQTHTFCFIHTTSNNHSNCITRLSRLTLIILHSFDVCDYAFVRIFLPVCWITHGFKYQWNLAHIAGKYSQLLEVRPWQNFPRGYDEAPIRWCSTIEHNG